mgnify:FL=1
MTRIVFGYRCGVILLILACAQSVVVSAKTDQIIDDAVYTRASVLIDVDNERSLNLYCTGSGEPRPRYSEAINKADLMLATQQPRIAAWTSEMTHVWRESSDQVRDASRPMGKIPMELLSREPPQPGPKETVELRERKNAEVARVHASTVALTTDGELIVVRNAGHYIQLEEPSVVIEAILNVANKYKISHQGDER